MILDLQVITIFSVIYLYTIPIAAGCIRRYKVRDDWDIWVAATFWPILVVALVFLGIIIILLGLWITAYEWSAGLDFDDDS